MKNSDKMTPTERHAAIRAYYLSLPGKTEAGWKEVAQDPAKFNRVWNHWLGLPASDKPPGTVQKPNRRYG